MREQLARDFERFSRELPREFPDYVRERYRIDLSPAISASPSPIPIGKGSGQLSLNPDQLESDRDAGLAFVVLKTVIAEDAAGERSMGAWAIHETRMKVERLRSAAGREGWTVTWKGRGWDRPFDDYLALVRTAADLTRSGAIVAVPSVKYHLPRLDEAFRDAEYRHTTEALSLAWGAGALPLEKDFSPTLAGDRLADERAQILRWLREVPGRIRAAAPVRLALKLMNARHDDDFQLRMIEAAARGGHAGRLQSALVGGAGNRLRRARPERPQSPRARRAGTTRCSRCLHSSAPEISAPAGSCWSTPGWAARACSSIPCSSSRSPSIRRHQDHASSARSTFSFSIPTDGVIAGMLDLEARGEIARSGGELRFHDLCRAR